MNVLFLDIDGVLNKGDFTTLGHMVPACVEAFNYLLRTVDVKVVLSSSWRYMVHGGDFTAKGFKWILVTHNVPECDIIDVTCRDEEIPTRGGQIVAWLLAHPEVTRYVVLDDSNHDFAACGLNHLKTEKWTGLTLDNAVSLVRYYQGDDDVFNGPFQRGRPALYRPAAEGTS